eukprot:CAMPEP_0179045534 /NCGR_PEP_ID=MMETSP0796-20121207/18226_1 /TAXON_ID=73915 /ORGANISM="Pyrodinium bahamense, Strain pbaha01" /LENGTH=391 /DNA_ID=CAMNT_0020741941 /DNA_START=44 /DNA_END=1220 /DNA_ORIENTATION=+
MSCGECLGDICAWVCCRDVGIKRTYDSKLAYVKFIKNATKSKKTHEYAELYKFLLDCFTHADMDFDGRVGPDEFDGLVERAAFLPRKWGFAPTSAEMFRSAAERREYRCREFAEINTSKSGYISFEEWLKWCYGHICEKAAILHVKESRSKMETNKEDFREFIIAAVKSRNSCEYKELHHFLQDSFTRADKDLDGLIGPKEFDELIEITATAPRRFGFAPPSSRTYKGRAERFAARLKMFTAMRVGESSAVSSKRGTVQSCDQAQSRKKAVYSAPPFSSDYISFDEWLNFVYAHICRKATTLDSALSGEIPPNELALCTSASAGAAASKGDGLVGLPHTGIGAAGLAWPGLPWRLLPAWLQAGLGLPRLAARGGPSRTTCLLAARHTFVSS